MSSARATSTLARKHAILEAALDCFTRHGIQATTIEQLCQQAGCSIGSIYHHFGNKEGIASGLFIHGMGKLHAALLTGLYSCSSAEQSVRAVVLTYSDWVSENRDLARYLLNSRDIAFTDAARQMLRRINQEYLQEIYQLFAPYVLRGEMKLLPQETYIPIISGPIEDYVRHWLTGQFRESPAKVKHVFAEAAWNAVRSDGVTAPAAGTVDGGIA
jgi:AcrR family transcriptional regulator